MADEGQTRRNWVHIVDRVSLVLSRRDGKPPEALEFGYRLDAEHEWIVTGPSGELESVRQGIGPAAKQVASILILDFGNSVGRYRAGPLGTLQVHSGKWTEAHYTQMIGDISTRAAALPFHAGTSSASPYARTELHSPDVLYHAFVWLRYVLLEDPEAQLIGALRQIIRDPHRRMAREERTIHADRARSLSLKSLEEISLGAKPLQRVCPGMGLFGGDLFPIEVSEITTHPTFDTAENRFVKAFLAACGAIIDAIRRIDTNPTLFSRVNADCVTMEGELAPILHHHMWDDVGEMHLFPASSTVLHRHPAYRQILRHHILMPMASTVLPMDTTSVQQMLEVKDIATLYEIWCAFAVIDAVCKWKGPPFQALQFARNNLGVSVSKGICVSWEDGTEVAYNPTYTSNTGFHGLSWSRQMRPDVALYVPNGPSFGIHVFDAKFRLIGSLTEDSDSEAKAKVSDLQKMHTYHDAIDEVRSAWVLYPGTEKCSFHPRSSCASRLNTERTVDGIGAVPVVPGEDLRELVTLVGAMLDSASTI